MNGNLFLEARDVYSLVSDEPYIVYFAQKVSLSLAKPFFEGELEAMLRLKDPQVERCKAVPVAFRVYHACKYCDNHQEILRRAKASRVNHDLWDNVLSVCNAQVRHFG